MLKVTHLYTYPIKSCRGISHSSIELNSQGMYGDRQLAVTHDGEIITQLKLPALASVVPNLNASGGIQLGAEGHGSEDFTIATEGDNLTVDIYGNSVQTIIQSNAINQWTQFEVI